MTIVAVIFVPIVLVYQAWILDLPASVLMRM